MENVFTIKKANEVTIEMYTVPYYGQELWMGEVWDDGVCLHSSTSPEGVDALRECEEYVYGLEHIEEQLMAIELPEEILEFWGLEEN